MTSTPPSPRERIDDELAALGAVLVEERVLRRVIKRHRAVRGFGLHVPHERCYVLPRADLERHVDPSELAVALDRMPAQVILVTGERELLAAEDPRAQTELWRALFHARIHRAFGELRARGELGQAAIRERVHRIGQTEFDAIRWVLRQENLLLPPGDTTEVYVELVALYLELRFFDPTAVEGTFPTELAGEGYDVVMSLDLDPEALLAATRPPRAPERPYIAPPEHAAVAEPAEPRYIEPSARRAAEKARRKGNFARAAILSARSGDRDGARGDVDALVQRIGRTFDAADTAGWTDGLLPLVDHAAAQPSSRSPSARLLHDLQAACVIAEREVKAVDVVGWALSRGKRGLVRPLPATRAIRAARRVRSGVHKLAVISLASAGDQVRLSEVLHAITKHADEHVRAEYRPVIVAALNAVGLIPHNLPERVAEKTLVDELLDRAISAGQLSLGDLRDALSRNDLKLPDLELGELATGDPLLRADQRLAVSLDGVYRRGESYMRALQKLSSLLFGTRIGRLLTRFVLLPLLGSFAVFEGIQQMGAPVAAKFGYELYASTRETLLGGAVVLFLLLHVTVVRKVVSFVLRWIWRAVRLLLFDIPLAIWRHPIVRWLARSHVVRWVIRPAIPAIVAVALSGGLGFWRWPIGVGVFVLAAIITNTRWVAVAEEIAADQVARFVRQLGRIVPGLVKLTLEVFARMVEVLERGLYRVDEWLRFRAGQPRIVLLLKGLFGTGWFFVTYVIRLYVNLFVEPTVNPIKHFPVVTIAAKIILPFIPAMLTAIAAATSPLVGPELANGFAAFTILVLPGLAGFLVWELKENWRVYRATRSKTLGPIIIGHHGETMARLLRPGFHSGTIPKLFTKLRRAAWMHDEHGVAKAREGLHHVEQAIELFAARQLVSMLNEAEAFRASDLTIAHVALDSNRIQIELTCESVAPESALVRIELQANWLLASVPRLGWIATLDEEQRRIVEVGLAGFYKLAAIELVGEQLEQLLRMPDGGAARTPRFAISDDKLLVWPGEGFETEVSYDLRSARLRRRVRGAHISSELPSLRGKHAVFAREPLFRTMWTSAWQQIMRGVTPMRVVAGPPLLPPPALPETTAQPDAAERAS